MKRAAMHPNHGHHGHGHAFLASGAPALPVKTARFVKIQSVACPDCGAAAGETCIGLTKSHSHLVRKRMATRADNKAREEAGTISPQLRKPGPLEDPAGGLCEFCGLNIRVTQKTGILWNHTAQGRQPTTGNYACPGSHTTPIH